MKHLIACVSLLACVACASGPEPYQRADSTRERGATVLPIEDNRLRISYRARDVETASTYALLAASEETLSRGAEWFRVVNAYTDDSDSYSSRGGTSVSIGGSTSSRGRSSVGVGIGIGLPVGGGSGGDVVRALEIIIGSGPQPDDPEVYDAGEVRDALLGAPAG